MKMGSVTILISVFAVFLIISTEGAANCPLPSKVYGCSPKCLGDYECGNGKVCCSNNCNTKSCSVPAAYNTGSSSSSSNKYGSSGAGIYCDNVKCNSFEVCKLDPVTKRNKCSRA